MPPKRKAAPATVTIKSEDDLMVTLPPGTVIYWQLEDKKVWETYSQEVSDGLTGAAMSGEKTVGLKSGARFSVEVNLVDMVQRGKTGAEKKVRGVVKGAMGDHMIWEILGDTWQPLQVGAVAKLEQLADMSSEVVVGGFRYDIEKMTRENVLNSEQKQEVRRLKVEVGACKKKGTTSKIVLDINSIEDQEDGKPAFKKSKQERKSGKKGDDAVEDKPKSVMKSVIRKGLAPVDSDCPHTSNYHVYCEGSTVWDTMLNQTNIQNNNNKYFLIQLLEADLGSTYAVWMRWGRVGYKGQNNWLTCGSNLESAKKIFMKKFSDKTYNSWDERDSFNKCSGKYDLVKMDYSITSSDTVDSVKSEIKSEPGVTNPAPAPSNLAPTVQELISLICNIQTMEQAVMEMNYDAKKAPLGKVTTQQISAGYTALKEISQLVNDDITRGPELTQACNDFYTRIPHEFGFQKPPLITSKEVVKQKLQLLEALADIQVALKMLSGCDGEDEKMNPVDRKYNQLGVDIKHLEKGDEERKLVEKSIKSTHAATHSMYNMDVMEVFSLDKDKESEEFNDVGDSRLLFHGSRLSNWAGILGQGLRIAPPEAPVTGYMFGKGVYFADMSSKSANYCFTTRSQPVGLLLLCQVSLGKQNKLVSADYEADKLPKGKHSVVGQGRVEPSSYTDMKGGMKIPMGPAKETKINNKNGYTLNYNEFIVYDTKQIKMKYLAKVKFNYNL